MSILSSLIPIIIGITNAAILRQKSIQGVPTLKEIVPLLMEPLVKMGG